MRAGIMGASGYIGGELLRLLLYHPKIEHVQATSDRFAGKPVHMVHPNLRGQTDIVFVSHNAIETCDVLFLALPHGRSLERRQQWENHSSYIINLSADFRLRDPRLYEAYYHRPHPCPDWLERFVPGLPELERTRLQDATWITMPGCMATATILGLYPLVQAGIIEGDVIVDAKTGSSGSGVQTGIANSHAERAGMMRVYQPLGHRHEAEVTQALGIPVQISATSVEAVRGVQILAHVRLSQPQNKKAIWRLYRHAYNNEPFIRLISQKTGVYRLPEPKILSGSNYCDIGFAIDTKGDTVAVIAALDNLVKGGAGNAVQCLNIICGWNEREGLTFPGLHPI